MMRFMSFD